MTVFNKGKIDASGVQSGGNGFVSVKAGESHALVPLLSLDGMISANFHEFWEVNPALFHPCIGSDCPACKLTSNRPRFKGYLPVMSKEDGVKIWPFTISVYRQLSALDDELEGGLKGYLVKLSRSGSGKNDTVYTVTCVGKKVDISKVDPPDFLEILGPTTPEAITKALHEKGIISGGKSHKEGDIYVTTTKEDDGWGDI